MPLKTQDFAARLGDVFDMVEPNLSVIALETKPKRKPSGSWN